MPDDYFRKGVFGMARFGKHVLIRVDHLERMVIEALGVLGKHPQLVQATLDAASLQKSPEAKKRQANLQTLEARLAEVVVERKRLEEIVLDPKRAALTEHMLDRLDAKLVEERRLKEEKHVLELTLQHEEAKALDREMVAKALESLSRVVEALPDTQRRELLHLLIGRLVVKPWEGENTGIQDGAIAIAPDIGTRRYSVKISLSESSLLSTKFTNSVDGSTFERIGWATPGNIRTFPGPFGSGLLLACPLPSRAFQPSPLPRCRFGSRIPNLCQRRFRCGPHRV